MDYWRKYFRTANSDIFEVIQRAIVVAASDWPQEFRAQRDQIAEKLFSCQLSTCRGCDRINELDLPTEKDESKIEAEDVEALTEETQEDSQMVQEVFRIKDILSDKDHQSDSVMFESLKRLQSMALSVDVLKVTEIGKAVNGLRKHRSREIRHLVRALIDGWKIVVDKWVHATAVITESTPESMNPSGLYNDEGPIFSSQTSMELSKFFDGMDDNRNLGNGVKNPPLSNGSSISEEKSEIWKQKPAGKQSETVDRRSKLQGFFMEPARKPQKAASIQKKPAAIDKNSIPEESSVKAKLEAAKRKLHERYQQAENAKKQRTIQVMEIQDIPNQSRQQNQKQGNNNSWSWR